MNKQTITLIIAGTCILLGGYLVSARNGKHNTNKPENSSSQTSENDFGTVMMDLIVKPNMPEVQSARVKQGQKVNIRITSEVTDQAHLHGYDILTPLEAGKKAVLSFTADKTGRFELELEKSEEKIAVLEVYP